MRDPLIEDILRIRRRRLKELKRDFKGAMAGSNELLDQICDVVLSETGERQYVISAAKMHDVLIAPRLQRK